MCVLLGIKLSTLYMLGKLLTTDLCFYLQLGVFQRIALRYFSTLIVFQILTEFLDFRNFNQHFELWSLVGFCAVLKSKVGVLDMLGRHSITKLHPQWINIFGIVYFRIVVQTHHREVLCAVVKNMLEHGIVLLLGGP